MNTTRSTISKNQSGIVSIVVTLIIMILLTLIIVSFARISRREQQQVLDRQLSTQAFYAAETGIADASQAIQKRLIDDEKDYTADCNTFIKDAGLETKSKITGGGNSMSEYTCLMVNLHPLSLEYGNVDTNSSKVIPVYSKDGDPIHSITIGWQDKAGGNAIGGCPSNPTFPVQWPANCSTGMMRVDLIPVGGSMTRDNMINRVATLYLYPSSGSGSKNTVSYGGEARPGFGHQGNVVRVDCAGSPDGRTGKQCNLTINGLNSLSSGTFMLRLKSIYNPSAATVLAARGADQLPLRFAQAEIDSTGKSNDVLRRIKVRIPISSTDVSYPEFAIQSISDICKRFAFAPGVGATPPTISSAPECDFNLTD